MILVVVSVMFITLLERKSLALSQIRLGVNKTSALGLAQPLIDGLKLILKEMFLPKKAMIIPFLLSSLVVLLSMFIIMGEVSLYFHSNETKYLVLMLFGILTLNTYSVMTMSFSSISKYSKLGSFRIICQMVSYEMILTFIMIMVSFMYMNYCLSSTLIVWWISELLILWLVSVISELNRAPSDFAEGESELVSGFNVEYSSMAFVFLFVGEYGFIVMFSIITLILFNLKILLFILVMSVLWIRSSFPRFRFDLLMILSWEILLPITILIFIVLIIL